METLLNLIMYSFFWAALCSLLPLSFLIYLTFNNGHAIRKYRLNLIAVLCLSLSVFFYFKIESLVSAIGLLTVPNFNLFMKRNFYLDRTHLDVIVKNLNSDSVKIYNDVGYVSIGCIVLLLINLSLGKIVEMYLLRSLTRHTNKQIKFLKRSMVDLLSLMNYSTACTLCLSDSLSSIYKYPMLIFMCLYHIFYHVGSATTISEIFINDKSSAKFIIILTQMCSSWHSALRFAGIVEVEFPLALPSIALRYIVEDMWLSCLTMWCFALVFSLNTDGHNEATVKGAIHRAAVGCLILSVLTHKVIRLFATTNEREHTAIFIDTVNSLIKFATFLIAMYYAELKRGQQDLASLLFCRASVTFEVLALVECLC